MRVPVFHSLIFVVHPGTLFAKETAASSPRRLARCSEELMDALAYCDTAGLTQILSAKPQMASCRTDSEDLPLHVVTQYFCALDCLGALEALLNAGANPNSKGSKRILSRTPLHLLADRSKPGDCTTGDDKLVTGVQLMIDKGADPNQDDDERRSPLELAKYRGANQKILSALGDRPDSSESSSQMASTGKSDATSEVKGDNDSRASVSVGMIAVVGALGAILLLGVIWKFCIKKKQTPASSLSTYTTPTSAPRSSSKEYALGSASNPSYTPASSTSKPVQPGTYASGKSNVSLKSGRSSASSKSQESNRNDGTNPGPMIIVATG